MAKQLTDEELRKKLSSEEYHILREKGTEAPFTGKLLNNKEKGSYVCPVCEAELFKSDHKFDSGSGWPSFYDVASTGAVKLTEDNSNGLRRVEVTCANCGSHLGHLFNDAHDQPTGQRYCINSASLKFMPKPDKGAVMDHKTIEQYLLSMKGAKLDYPFGEDVAVYKANDKMFALVAEKSNPVRISLKCDPLLAETLREKYETVMPGYHLNKKHWNTIVLTGQLPLEEIQGLIRLSYDLATTS